MKDASENLQRLQVLDQNLQQVAMQRQQFSSQLFEVEGALKELESSEVAYKIVGGVMFGVKKAELKSDLESKKELIELRVKTLEKQEQQLREKFKKLQEDLKE
jgi:prefoldin beta subunit